MLMQKQSLYFQALGLPAQRERWVFESLGDALAFPPSLGVRSSSGTPGEIKFVQSLLPLLTSPSQLSSVTSMGVCGWDTAPHWTGAGGSKAVWLLGPGPPGHCLDP